MLEIGCVGSVLSRGELMCCSERGRVRERERLRRFWLGMGDRPQVGCKGSTFMERCALRNAATNRHTK